MNCNSSTASSQVLADAHSLVIKSGASQWFVHEVAQATSTNLLAAQLPAWNAVRADEQSAGRGRFQRTWISDRGGLWLSAVVPSPSEAQGIQLLPLAAGLAVCQAMHSFGAAHLRLRWPNDVLHTSGKLAGLLIDRFVPDRVVVGIGINVTNHPERHDPSLHGQVCCLTDLVRPAPTLSELTAAVLTALWSVWTQLQQPNPAALLSKINALWPSPLQVEVDLDGHLLCGSFHGVDLAGRLLLSLENGQRKSLEPHEVRLLREIPPNESTP